MNDQVKTAPGSIWSLVLGILSFTCFSILTGIPAVICGHITLSKINKSAGTLTGSGMAIAGLVLGYISIAIAIFIIPLQLAIAIPSFMKARTTSQKNACINNLRQIEAAKDQYGLETGHTNGWAFADDSEAFYTMVAKQPAFIKQYPACPVSASAEAKGTVERAVADYKVNAIGSSPACKVCPEKHVLKPFVNVPENGQANH